MYLHVFECEDLFVGPGSFGCGIIQHVMQLNFLMCADVYTATARLQIHTNVAAELC